MKVTIIGAGPAGLSTAISLHKHLRPHLSVSQALKITIYEKPSRQYHDTSPSGTTSPDVAEQRRRDLGAGVSLQSNGVRVLRALDASLGDAVHDAGFPIDHFKWWTAGGVLLGKEYVGALPVSRPLLVDCLFGKLPGREEGVEVRYRSVKGVVVGEGRRPVVEFEDGQAEEVDLVVGADGVGSVVRRSLFGDGEGVRAEYLGYCGVGGVLAVPLPEHLLNDPCINFFMGSTGHFGYTGLSQSDHNKLLYWSIFDTDLPTRGLKPDNDVLLKELRARHGDWSDPMIAQCLAKAEVDNIYSIFVMPELPRWGRNGCVLVGDAAHALPPRTGQGTSQAFEDAQTLGLLLGKLVQRFDVAEAVEKAVDGLYEVRHGRVYRMRSWATKWKDPKMPMSSLQTLGLYAFLFVFVKIRYLMAWFEKVDDWDAEVEVKRYLARTS